jgi:hypothetical protein
MAQALLPVRLRNAENSCDVYQRRDSGIFTFSNCPTAFRGTALRGDRCFGPADSNVFEKLVKVSRRGTGNSHSRVVVLTLSF